VDDLMSEFLAETREMLDAIAGEIVAWEADPSDRARLDAIFRFVHTVKGSCGFLDLPRLARLSHAAEDVLAEVRAGRRTPNPQLVSGVLAIVDRIGELVTAIGSGESLDDKEDHKLVAALERGNAVEPPAIPAATARRGPARSIRLPIELLDRLMSGVSDMVLARNELARELREVHCSDRVDTAFERLSTTVGELRDAISRTRMQRLDQLFAALPRMVRDLASELGREVALEVDGGDVELDREMIEAIRDPIAHIIRNAIDHGIEPPERRRTAGKPVAGLLRIAARQSGNQIVIEASDDGAGIDADRVAARAVAGGLISAERAVSLSLAARLDLVFLPGLSTSRTVTEISGRGVGMDVVRANVERIGGVTEVQSTPGAGTRLTLRVPLTLTIMPALTVSIAGQRFAIPRAAIEEIVRLGRGGEIERLGGGIAAIVRGRRMPFVDAAAVLVGGEAIGNSSSEILVVLRLGAHGRFALAVNAAHDHEELVVKAASPVVMATGLYAGTTLPDSGRPMLLLDAAGIAAAAGVSDLAETPAPVIEEVGETVPLVPTLLFRDLDGVGRAVRLSLVERIDEVPASAVRIAAGQPRIELGGRLLPILASAPLPHQARLRLLRLTDGTAALAYAIDSVLDIAALGPPEGMPREAGPMAGVLLVDGGQVELLDGHWHFAEAARLAAADARAPLCLLGDSADGWTRDILAPLVATAGYRVAFAGDPIEELPAIEIAPSPGAAPASGAPLVRLRRERDAEATEAGEEDSIYRYDREAILAVLRTHGARALA
jgi:two-component system chemotaxis sensor kinase CheA